MSEVVNLQVFHSVSKANVIQFGYRS